jgi:hypothetical protein
VGATGGDAGATKPSPPSFRAMIGVSLARASTDGAGVLWTEGVGGEPSGGRAGTAKRSALPLASARMMLVMGLSREKAGGTIGGELTGVGAWVSTILPGFCPAGEPTGMGVRTTMGCALDLGGSVAAASASGVRANVAGPDLLYVPEPPRFPMKAAILTTMRKTTTKPMLRSVRCATGLPTSTSASLPQQNVSSWPVLTGRQPISIMCQREIGLHRLRSLHEERARIKAWRRRGR